MSRQDPKLRGQTIADSTVLAKLLEIGQSLIVVQDLGMLLRKITEGAGSVLGADVIVLYEYQEKIDDVMMPPTIWGDLRHPEVLEAISHVRLHRESAVFKVLARTEPFYAPSAREDWAEVIEGRPECERDPSRFVYRENIVSSAAVSLMADEECVGVLFVNYRTPHGFHDEAKETIELFATQAAIAIRNARLYQNLERRVRELEVLTKIGQTVSTLGVDQILNLVYEQTSKIMDLKDTLFYIAFYDEARDEVSFGLVVEQSEGQTIEEIRWGKREEKDIPQWVPKGRQDPPDLTGYVIRTRQPVLIPEDFDRQSKEYGIQIGPEIGRLRRSTHSWLGVPMMVQDRVIGAISVQGLEREHAFDQSHLELLSAVANQAAVAIENARLYAQLELQLSTTEKQREALQRLVGLNDLAGRFVHRVSQLVGTIPLDIEFIQEEIQSDAPNSQAVLEELEGIKTQTKQLLGMARRIRESTQKLEESRDSRFLQKVEVVELLDQALAEVCGPERKPSWGDQVVLATPYKEAPPMLVETFRTLFIEALINVITNAVEAMPQGGTLRLDAQRCQVEGKEWAVIEIADTGIGIPAEHLERIFSIGYSTKPEGFGYGLWLVRHICDATGAQIHVESTMGEGTKFHLLVPLATGAQEAQQPKTTLEDTEGTPHGHRERKQEKQNE